MSFRDNGPILLILLDFIFDRTTRFVGASEQARIAELRGELCEALRRPLPLELLDARKQRRVRAQRRKPLEQQRKFPALAQNIGRMSAGEADSGDDGGGSGGDGGGGDG